MAYGTPFISGKDSLNNEFQTDDGETIAIPPTLLISAICVIDDVGRCVTTDAKAAGQLPVPRSGRTRAELGGCHYLLVEGARKRHRRAAGGPGDEPARSCRPSRRAIEAGCVRACHDLSEGGLAVAAAEMAFAGGLGVELDLAAVAADRRRDRRRRAVRRVGRAVPRRGRAGPVRRVPSAGRGLPFGEIGRVTDTGRVVIRHEDRTVIDLPATDAKAAWQERSTGERRRKTAITKAQREHKRNKNSLIV